MKRSNNPREFLTPEESSAVEEAVAHAEQASCAEVKLIIARHCWMNIKKKAAMLFKKHGLDRTEQRNCVLVLLITTERQFLIYGDEGIHAKVGQEFWDDVRDTMTGAFQQDRFGDGLAEGITSIGARLAEHFPYHEGDQDEISNEVAYDD